MTSQADSALTLQTFGSFYLAGQPRVQTSLPTREVVLAPGGVPVTINPNGTQWLGQMYVQYFFPAQSVDAPPLSFWHGGSMTGAMWEQTPDGRAGWMQWFLRRGWRVYNADAVERGRSGWSPDAPPFAEAPILRTAEDCFTQFRIGSPVSQLTPQALSQAAYPNCQFPLEHFSDFMCQVVPRWTKTDQLMLEAWCELLERTGPVTIVAHSQGAVFALRAAARCPNKVAAIVAIEPAQAAELRDITALSAIPVLVIYGDNLELDKRWPQIRQRTDVFFHQLQQQGGDVTLVDLPQHGIDGNSHLLMMERNSDAIAQLINDWLLQKCQHNPQRVSL